jgi:hypothetical protein
MYRHEAREKPSQGAETREEIERLRDGDPTLVSVH